MNSRSPIIGITVDVTQVDARVRLTVGDAYAQNVAAAGGIPLLLPPIIEHIPVQLAIVDGVVFTGGGDVRMEAFGQPTHAQAEVMHERRQSYEIALLEAINGRGPYALARDLPVLGICLGMQLMALDAGGMLNQHLPDSLPTASTHRGAVHPMVVEAAAAKRLGIGAGAIKGEVDSYHHQAVQSPGTLQVLAKSEDGVIEAVAAPNRKHYVGVQWHPERTADPSLGLALFKALVAQAAEYRSKI